MSPEPRHVNVTLQTTLESVDLGEDLAQQVAGAAGFDEDERYKIGMAVRECIVNALEHGNRGDAKKRIELRFLLEADRLVVQVHDEGSGFALDVIPDPRTNENLLKSSGRGLFLVRTFMDDLRVKSGQVGGATVTMTKLYSTNHGGSADLNLEKETEQ
ncbi:MAG: ATP-binding protein [Terriglobia bacterium]